VSTGFGSYLAGSLSIVAIGAALGLGGYWLRRWIVPQYAGALARLAEVVIAVALLVITLQLLGSVSLLREGFVVAGLIVAGLLAAAIGRAKAPADAEGGITAPQVGRLGLFIALAVASFTVAEWTFPSQISLDKGMFGGDTTWYHMPFAAGFAQLHSTTHLHFTDPLRLVVWFYPASSELINSAGIIIMHSDWLSPLLNLGWLVIGLLAAWCVGRPYGVGPATLVASALVFDSGVLVVTQAGEGRNDIMAIALLVAFVAFLVNGHQRPHREHVVTGEETEKGPLLDTGSLIMAGIAGGLAISVKLTMLPPVAAITLGMIVFRGGGRRLATAGILGASLFVAGGYWYVRNFFSSGGNPIPLIHWGPLNLPAPDQLPLDPRPRFSVAHYLTTPTIYRTWFFPQLDNALGPLYPLILVAAIAAVVFVIVRSQNRVLRVLAAAALFTAAVYVVTPLTAAGPDGQPRGFFTNTRYLMPGLVLALVLLPLARPLRSDEKRAGWVLMAIALVYWITVLTTPSWPIRYLGGAIILTAMLVWVPVYLGWGWWSGRLSKLRAVGIAAAVLLLAIVLGRAQQVQYELHHYTDSSLFLQEGGPVKAFDVIRPLHDKRIGISGSGEIFFDQYGFYGEDLSNTVQYIGVKGPHGQFVLADNCRTFRREINAGNYNYVVISQYTNDDPSSQYAYAIRAWTKDLPQLKEIVSENVTPQPVWVYKVRGKVNPATCGASRPGAAPTSS
jgi:hypothetical protein